MCHSRSRSLRPPRRLQALRRRALPRARAEAADETIRVRPARFDHVVERRAGVRTVSAEVARVEGAVAAGNILRRRQVPRQHPASFDTELVELGDDTGGIELVVVDVIVRIDDAHNYFCACPVIGTKRTGNSDSVCISPSRFVSRSSS